MNFADLQLRVSLLLLAGKTLATVFLCHMAPTELADCAEAESCTTCECARLETLVQVRAGMPLGKQHSE